MDYRVKNISDEIFSGVRGMEAKGIHLEPGEVSASLNFDTYQRLLTLYENTYLAPYLGRNAEPIVVPIHVVEPVPSPIVVEPVVVPKVETKSTKVVKIKKTK